MDDLPPPPPSEGGSADAPSSPQAPMEPTEPTEPTGSPTPSTQPWWARTPVLLGIGAAVLAAALGFALLGSGDDDAPGDGTAATRTDGSTPAPDGEGEGGGSEGGAGEGGEARLADVEEFAPEWIFRDPNRAVGDGGFSLSTATWLLDDRVVVVSADIMRAHSLDDGSVLWEVPLEGFDPCTAVSDLPADSSTVVIGIAEPDDLCSRLRAFDVETGEVKWTTAVEEFDINTIERVIATPAGLFVLDSNGVSVRNIETGKVKRLHSRDELGVRVSGNPADDPFFAADHGALDAEAGVVLVTGAVISFETDAEPTHAVAFDAESGQLLWSTQVSPERLDAVPQNHDPRFLMVGADPYEVVKLDLEEGTVTSRYPVPEQTAAGRPVYELYPHLGAPWYRTGTVPVDDDLVMVYEQVDTPGRGTSDDNLVRIDGTTGEEEWRVTVADIPETTEGESASLMLTAGPMVDEEHLMVLAWNHRRSWIVFVDAASGEVASVVPQPDEITNSYIQGQPALHVIDGDRVLMVYNPNGGHNSVEDAAITGDDRTSVILLRPAS